MNTLSYVPPIADKFGEKVQLLGSSNITFGYVLEISRQIENSDIVLVTGGQTGGAQALFPFNIETATMHTDKVLSFTPPWYMAGCHVLPDGMVAVGLADTTNIQNVIRHIRLYRFDPVALTFTQIATRTVDTTVPSAPGITITGSSAGPSDGLNYGLGLAKASNGDYLISTVCSTNVSTAGRYFQFFRIYRSRSNGPLVKIQDVFRNDLNVSGAPPYVMTYSYKNIAQDYLFYFAHNSTSTQFRRTVLKYDGNLYQSFVDESSTSSGYKTFRVDPIVAGSDLLLVESKSTFAYHVGNNYANLVYSISKVTVSGLELIATRGSGTIPVFEGCYRVPMSYNYDTDALFSPGPYSSGVTYTLTSLGFNPQAETFNRTLTSAREFKLPHMTETKPAPEIPGDIVGIMSTDSSKLVVATRNGPRILIFSN